VAVPFVWYNIVKSQEEYIMTVLEKTVSMLENFSDVDLLKIQNMITVVFMEKHDENPFRVLSGQEILSQLSYSHSQAMNGQVADVGGVCETIANKYGL